MVAGLRDLLSLQGRQMRQNFMPGAARRTMKVRTHRCRRHPRHVSLRYTTACRDRVGSAVGPVSPLPTRPALPDSVLAVGRAPAQPRLGHAQTTHAPAARPPSLLDRVADGARRLLERRRVNSETGWHSARPTAAPGRCYLVSDCRHTLIGRSGKKQPLAHDTRLNEGERFTFAHSVLLLVAHWGRLRIPVGAVVLDPKRRGQQNIQLRQFLRQFQPPAWCRRVIVLADAGFASKANLQVIQGRGWSYVVCLPRNWKLADGTHLRDLARYLPKSRYHRVASSTPDQQRRDYWVFVRRTELRLLGDVTVLLSKKRRNSGPQQVKVIVTNLDNATATTMLSAYARRWGVEVTFRELKSGLHLGQIQVTRRAERVIHALLLPVLAYLLLLRLYGRTLEPEQGATLYGLKQRFMEEVTQEHLERTERKWKEKLRQARIAA